MKRFCLHCKTWGSTKFAVSANKITLRSKQFQCKHEVIYFQTNYQMQLTVQNTDLARNDKG
jgi:hypothetical protein